MDRGENCPANKQVYFRLYVLIKMLMHVEVRMQLFDEASSTTKKAGRGKQALSFFPPRCVCGDGTDMLKVEGLITLRRHDAESK